MLRNPLARHVTLFLAVKAVLIALGLWWFLSSMPEPRGAVALPAAATQR
ncbi:hypothetical protein [Azospirillum sp.]